MVSVKSVEIAERRISEVIKNDDFVSLVLYLAVYMAVFIHFLYG